LWLRLAVAAFLTAATTLAATAFLAAAAFLAALATTTLLATALFALFIRHVITLPDSFLADLYLKSWSYKERWTLSRQDRLTLWITAT
jgi:hypothetical protein